MTIAKKTVLAIIPARQGSRRCPDKNLTIYGPSLKPLILHAIDHARASRYIDSIIVSSDSDAILKYATPPVQALKRPTYLASDFASSESVIVHALYNQQLHPDSYCLTPLPDFFVLLQPTSPNRLPSDIDACIELANKSHYGCSVSVNSQSSPPFLRNGAVYVALTERFLATLSLNAAENYLMPASRSLDIDLPEDFLK